MTDFIRVISRLLAKNKSVDVTGVVVKLLDYVFKGFGDLKCTMTHSARTFRTMAEELPGILAPHTSSLIEKVLDPEFVA